jgi:hypothetical protein
MNRSTSALIPLAASAALAVASGWAGTTAQIGSSGKTFASTAVQCDIDPATSLPGPMVMAGLVNPKPSTSATVSLNGSFVASVNAAAPEAKVWLATGGNTVVVALSRKQADSYAFTVSPYQCSLPDTSGNWFSSDGSLEYAADGKSYATVTPGCALNAATGRAQPYVHLFDNGGFLLNVSVNGVPLTQLSAYKTHTPVFLAAGVNIISVANASISTGYYIRDAGDGNCVLP